MPVAWAGSRACDLTCKRSRGIYKMSAVGQSRPAPTSIQFGQVCYLPESDRQPFHSHMSLRAKSCHRLSHLGYRRCIRLFCALPHYHRIDASFRRIWNGVREFITLERE
jgi:hypothetical protein